LAITNIAFASRSNYNDNVIKHVFSFLSFPFQLEEKYITMATNGKLMDSIGNAPSSTSQGLVQMGGPTPQPSQHLFGGGGGGSGGGGGVCQSTSHSTSTTILPPPILPLGTSQHQRHPNPVLQGAREVVGATPGANLPGGGGGGSGGTAIMGGVGGVGISGSLPGGASGNHHPHETLGPPGPMGPVATLHHHPSTSSLETDEEEDEELEGMEIAQSPVSSTGSSLSIASRPASASAIPTGPIGGHMGAMVDPHHQLVIPGVVGVVGMGLHPPQHLNLHIRSVGSPGTGVENYKCAYCGFYTEDINKMKKHKRTHQEKQPYRCEFCLKQFTKPHQLKEHVLVHTGEKPYSCEFCDQKFRQQNALKVRPLIFISYILVIFLCVLNGDTEESGPSDHLLSIQFKVL
jgi:hypothetical protein